MKHSTSSKYPTVFSRATNMHYSTFVAPLLIAPVLAQNNINCSGEYFDNYCCAGGSFVGPVSTLKPHNLSSSLKELLNLRSPNISLKPDNTTSEVHHINTPTHSLLLLRLRILPRVLSLRLPLRCIHIPRRLPIQPASLSLQPFLQLRHQCQNHNPHRRIQLANHSRPGVEETIDYYGSEFWSQICIGDYASSASGAAAISFQWQVRDDGETVQRGNRMIGIEC